MKPVHILWPAEQEIVDGATYYDLQSPGLGSSFLDKVEMAISDIAKNPDRWPVLAFEVRRRLIQRFPYAILYRDDPDEILVLAVLHLRRRPWYWLDRL